MEEITLTGGTLAGGASPPNASSNNSSTATGNGPKDVSQEIFKAVNHGQVAHSHNHGHSHSHGHSHNHHHSSGGSCCGPKQPMPMPEINLKMPPADLVRNQTEDQLLSALFLLTKMGKYELLQQIVDAWKDFKGEDFLTQQLKRCEETNQEGHTMLHWSAKRTDDIRYLQFWSKYIPLTTKTSDGTGMTALHWACTEGESFAIIQYILSSSPDATSTLLELRDDSGCTPLLLAAQHGNVETVAYLVHQYHARLDALDDNGDSATHWAAYKGASDVLGLLAYYEKQDSHAPGVSATQPSPGMLQKPDAYGQTPLHLAALRGHSTACQYILRQIAGQRNEHKRDALQILSMPDKNGRTPYDLAVHKQKPHTAAVLQQAERTLTLGSSRQAWIPRNQKELQNLVQVVVIDWLCNSHKWRQWMGIPTGVDDPMDVAPSFPNYYVFLQIVLNAWFSFSVYVPIFNLGKGIMWDYTGMHVTQFILLCLTSFFLYKTQTTNPGRLDDSCPEINFWRKMYGDILASYADNDKDSVAKRDQLKLCHTSHIARPPRSKYDRATGACVLLFDHNCPFVGNTVGLYNYKWFYFFLLSMTWYFINHIILLIIYCRRATSLSFLTMALGIYLAIHIFMAGGMFIYHTQLTAANLTTNEHINMKRYDYLWTSGNGSAKRFHNPWNRGILANFMDRLNPSHSSYMLPESQERLLSPSGNPKSALEMV